jgi:hypothetical protein
MRAQEPELRECSWQLPLIVGWHDQCAITKCASVSKAGSFKLGTFLLSLKQPLTAQRLSSTAVYPPCPRVSGVSSDGLNPGHGGYTARS